MKDENTVSQEIQIQAKHYNCTLLRNNSGALLDKDGRLVRFGLGNVSKKHTDLICVTGAVPLRTCHQSLSTRLFQNELRELVGNPDTKRRFPCRRW